MTNVPADRYLDLLEMTLTRSGPHTYSAVYGDKGVKRTTYTAIARVLARRGLTLSRPTRPLDRERGLDVPMEADTMIGVQRLHDLRQCIATVLAEDVPGDLLEAGVWRGGSCVFMRAALLAAGDTSRTVWVADSFQGMPPTELTAPQDSIDHIGQLDIVSVSQADVEATFTRYDLLDRQVRFLPGWFHESLPASDTGPLALLRLDADLYASTTDVLTHLYDRVSIGGFVVVDDYGLATCRAAVDDFRAARGIDDPLTDIDGSAVRWRRSS